MDEPRYFKCFVKSKNPSSFSFYLFCQNYHTVFICPSVQASRHHFLLPVRYLYNWCLCFCVVLFLAEKEIRLREENIFSFGWCISFADMHLKSKHFKYGENKHEECATYCHRDGLIGKNSTVCKKDCCNFWTRIFGTQMILYNPRQYCLLWNKEYSLSYSNLLSF